MPAQAEAASSGTAPSPTVTHLARFRDNIGRLLHRPPDQGIAREAFAAAVGDRETWTRRGDRTVTKKAVHGLYWALFGRCSHGAAPTTLEELGTDCGLSSRVAVDAMHVLRHELRIVAVRTAPRRGHATVYEITPGGMPWRMAVHVAEACGAAGEPDEHVEAEPDGIHDPVVQPEGEPTVEPADAKTPALLAVLQSSGASAEAAPTTEPGSGDITAERGVTMTPKGVGSTYTTTTIPPSPPAGGAPPATAAQRDFAEDLGVDVEDLDVVRAGKVIEIANFRRRMERNRTAASNTEASPAPPQRQRPPRRGLRHPVTGRRLTGAEIRRIEDRGAVAGYPDWAVEQLEAQGVEFEQR